MVLVVGYSSFLGSCSFYILVFAFVGVYLVGNSDKKNKPTQKKAFNERMSEIMEKAEKQSK